MIFPFCIVFFHIRFTWSELIVIFDSFYFLFYWFLSKKLRCFYQLYFLSFFDSYLPPLWYHSQRSSFLSSAFRSPWTVPGKLYVTLVLLSDGWFHCLVFGSALYCKNGLVCISMPVWFWDYLKPLFFYFLFVLGISSPVALFTSVIICFYKTFRQLLSIFFVFARFSKSILDSNSVSFLEICVCP